MGLTERVGECLIFYMERGTHTLLLVSHTQTYTGVYYIMDYQLNSMR